MKRDARIGLAVVLVLGLTVSLVVGRVLYKRSQTLLSNVEPTAEDYQALLNAMEYSNAVQPPPGARGNDSVAIVPPIPSVGSSPDSISSLGADIDRRLPAATTRSLASSSSVNSSERPTSPVASVLNSTPTPPPSGTAVMPESTRAHVYVVQAGDSPWKIAERLYGNGKHAAEIMKANPNVDPKRLVAGRNLVIPSLPGLILKVNLPLAPESSATTTVESVAPASMTSALNAPPTIAGEKKGTTHVIRANDTFVVIARRYYGSSSNDMIEKIRKANPDVDPRRLSIGQTIFVPARE